MKTKLILFVLSLMSVLSLSAKTPDAALPEVSSNQEAAVNVLNEDVFITGYGLPAGEVVWVYVFDVRGFRLYSSRNRVTENGTISLLMYLPTTGVYAIKAVERGREYVGRFLYRGEAAIDVILR